MELAFPWPFSQGEWLAWSSAAVAVLVGLLMMFAPRTGLRVLRLQTSGNHPEALSEPRSTIAGFYLGLGMACILLAQPLLYLALGACWALAAFGRMVSMLSDGGNTPYNWFVLLIQLVLAGLALSFALGFVA